MPPLVHGDLIYIGPAGAETAARGWVGSFRISDGEQVWRFNIVPDDGEPGADTWGPNSAARQHGGGNLWTPMSFDEKKNLLYVPGGNAAPDLYDDDRPGNNLYTNSLISLDTTTGHLVWYRQFIPHDVHDYDVSHVAPVFKTTINGSPRDVIASTGKDGLLRLLDRESKDLIYSVPFTNRMNAEAPVLQGTSHDFYGRRSPSHPAGLLLASHERTARSGRWDCAGAPVTRGRYQFHGRREDRCRDHLYIDGAEERGTAAETLRRLYWDTALSWKDPILQMLRSAVGMEQVLYGSDFPYLRRDLAVRSRVELESTSALGDAERAGVLGANALRLFPRLGSLR
jgi:hypothetical protein